MEEARQEDRDLRAGSVGDVLPRRVDAGVIRIEGRMRALDEAYRRAVLDLGIFDRAFFRAALEDDRLFETLSPELKRRAQSIRGLLGRTRH